MNMPILSTRSLVVGTRGSALARWQTEFVIAALGKIAPTYAFELHVITTGGDRDQTRPLAEFGALGVFTSELENALRAGEIDIAVHSLKDLPTDLADDLPIAAILERGDARDVLVSRRGVGLQQLANGARVGTSSARRAAQLRALRPDLEIVPLRGNIDTRLKKAGSAEYDAIVLAAAGLVRLGRGDAITEYFTVEQMTPDPGQGALAVQVRGNDSATLALVTKLDHAPTRRAVTAERAFLRALGGGCRMPMAAFAEQEEDVLHLQGMLAASDGTKVLRAEARGAAVQPETLGQAVAEQILSKGGNLILVSVPQTLENARHTLRGKRIVVTRAATQADELAQKIRTLGGEPVLYPTIAFAPLDDLHELDAQLRQLETFDWIVFTSANGVRAASQRLQALGLDSSALTKTRVAAIGTGTAHTLTEYHVPVDFIPTEFLGAQIARELPATSGTRALLLRADLASDELAQGLAARGVTVTDIDAYRTVAASPPPPDWASVDAVTFTSASTVKYCWQLLDAQARAEIVKREIFCIGPVTAAAARALGLSVTATATEHTLDGLTAALSDYYERNSHVT